jgi:hypothetical protein
VCINCIFPYSASNNDVTLPVFFSDSSWDDSLFDFDVIKLGDELDVGNANVTVLCAHQ